MAALLGFLLGAWHFGKFKQSILARDRSISHEKTLEVSKKMNAPFLTYLVFNKTATYQVKKLRFNFFGNGLF
jgi:hypothetical protein